MTHVQLKDNFVLDRLKGFSQTSRLPPPSFFLFHHCNASPLMCTAVVVYGCTIAVAAAVVQPCTAIAATATAREREREPQGSEWVDLF